MKGSGEETYSSFTRLLVRILELSFTVEHLHTSANTWNFMDDGSSTRSFDDIDQEKFWGVGSELRSDQPTNLYSHNTTRCVRSS